MTATVPARHAPAGKAAGGSSDAGAVASGPSVGDAAATAVGSGGPIADDGSRPDAGIATDAPTHRRDDGRTRVVLVTGPSGAGRSTAIAVLEDLGFEAIDNLPLSLLGRLLADTGHDRIPHPLALGIDVRNRDFTTQGMVAAIDRLMRDPAIDAEVLYLDASRDILLRRYSETRRRHPLAPADTPDEGIARERELLAPIRETAGVLIDTSDLSPHDLRAEIERWFGTPGAPALAVSVQSFSYKRGLPRGVDMVLDVRFLRNPHWERDLRGLTGMDAAVARYVTDDRRWAAFASRVDDLLDTLLPAYVDEGKTHFSIAFGCTGGRHRSVTAAEYLSRTLADKGWPVSTRHREQAAQGRTIAERTGPETEGGAGPADAAPDAGATLGPNADPNAGASQADRGTAT